jgi:hypothetical protein
MEKNGNKKSNQYFEATLTSSGFQRPSPRHSPQLFQKFLHDKYLLLRFIKIQKHETIDQHLASLKVVTASRDVSTSAAEQQQQQYQCERYGKDDMEVTKFIEKIGENRKIIQKETLGPLYLQQELEKQSQRMKQQFVLEEKKKQDQLIRSMSAMHEISQRKKEFNRSQSEKMKPLKLEKEKQQKELKLIRREEKSQKSGESEKRRKERKEEAMKRNRFLFYSNLSYCTPRIHASSAPSASSAMSREEANSCYPPLPKKSQLHRIDKRGLRYAVAGEEVEEGP